jgi:WD repeat-containing protein 40A
VLRRACRLPCREHFSGEQVFNACYSHAWDPSATRLMAVGGPLAYGLRGCYMALWD